jgi:undecaprenyl diphosphate synthase
VEHIALAGDIDYRDRTVPRHVGIIMDGNGRWAAARGMPRSFGHKAGVEAVRRTVRAAAELGISYLTLYRVLLRELVATAFRGARPLRPDEALHHPRPRGTVRQWRAHPRARRPRRSVADILGLIETAETKVAPQYEAQPQYRFQLWRAQRVASGIRQTCNEYAEQGHDFEEVSEEDIAAALDTGGQPDPDLLIRTSGEMRLSNFMLWQTAYSEFVFLPCMWPDFDETWLEKALRRIFLAHAPLWRR